MLCFAHHLLLHVMHETGRWSLANEFDKHILEAIGTFDILVVEVFILYEEVYMYQPTILALKSEVKMSTFKTRLKECVTKNVDI